MEAEKKVKSIADAAEKWGSVPVAAMGEALNEFCANYGRPAATRLKDNSDVVWEMYDIMLSRLVQQPPVYDHALMAAKLTTLNIASRLVK
jgi:hypothetical protein